MITSQNWKKKNLDSMLINANAKKMKIYRL
jgi:hypothetical protein